MPERFTWVPLYHELAERLANWEKRQGELIAFLEKLKNDGLKVGRFVDQDPPGNEFLLKEIDPFTFFATFNHGGKDASRRAILAEMKKHFGAASELPSDFEGIPVVSQLNLWFFAYQFHRDLNDIPRLWKVFRLALGSSPLKDEAFLSAFDDALKVRQTSFNLTLGLFWIRPQVFLSLDSNNRKFLNIKVPSSGLNSDFYRKTVAGVASSGKGFLDLSREAWLHANKPGSDDEPSPPPIAPPVGPKTRYWAISLGQGGRLWNQCRQEGMVAIGWDYLGDLRHYATKEEIRDAILAHENDELKHTNDALACYQFCREMKTGDVVFAKQGQTTLLGCGRVTSDYEHVPDRPEYHNVRRVTWVHQDSHDIPENASVPLKTLTEMTSPDFLAFALPFLEGPSASPSPSPTYTIDQALNGLFLDKDVFREFHASLVRKKNAIIQGPPGVGKTFIARRLAYFLIGSEADDHIEMVQFHQSYSYEDFVQGWRPTEKGGFIRQDSVFLNFCAKARNDPDPESKYVFIIDEINRGNLSKIFGELFMLIEGDKRGPDWEVHLAYAPETTFCVPANVYLLGLMNTADRSLAMVDYALRRRFRHCA
ncbi:MAG: AAA family ATPase [Gemmataceae bacterium]